MPKVNVIREHDVNVLVILTRKHGIPTIDFAGENSHALVLGSRAVQGHKEKQKEVGSLYKLWHDHSSVVGSERRIINVPTIIVSEVNEPCVFDTVALRRRCGEDNSLR